MSEEVVKIEEEVLEVLTPEQLEKFPKEVKEKIEYLSSSIHKEELLKFNPLVSGLLSLEETVESLKLIPADEDGNYNKVNIQSFVDAKKDIKSYRAGVKVLVKAFKAPRILENKAFSIIETKFIELATKIYDDAELEFDPYVQAEKEKAIAKQAKKDALLNAKVNEAKAQASAAVEKSNRSLAFNEVKYERIAEQITTATNKAILESNEKTLTDLKEEIALKTYESLTHNVPHVDLLTPDVVAELKRSFLESKMSAVKLIEDKLASYKTEKDNLVLTSIQEKPVVVQAPVDTPSIVVPTYVPPVPVSTVYVSPTNEIDIRTTDDQFLEKIIAKLSLMKLAVDIRIKTTPASSPKVYKLQEQLNEITKTQE